MKTKKTDSDKRLVWFITSIGLGLIIFLIFLMPGVFLSKTLFFLLLCCLSALIRVFIGPTAADRACAMTIMGMMVIGFCGILAVFTRKDWYLDIAFIWALQSFIVALSLAKFLEGKRFDQ
ncbi:MAG: multiple resistance and pH regulation protein F [Candidatus Omnitrophica bacterium]|nr:multiple resistance and pH regulation protein F [Candidatus Omnitrophota bacterium]